MPRRRVYDDALAGMEGALCDVSARKLLDACRERRITGVLRLTSWERAGGIQMRAGQIEQVSFGPLRDDDALAEMLALRDGTFELQQEMPDLGRARSRHPGRTALSTLMRQCRERLLSCTITMIRDREHAELFYRAGELLYCKINGISYDGDAREAARELERFEHGCARVAPLPLELTSQIPGNHAEAVPITVVPASSRPRRRVATPPPVPAHRARTQPLQHRARTDRSPMGTPPGGMRAMSSRAPTARGTPAKGVPPMPPLAHARPAAHQPMNQIVGQAMGKSVGKTAGAPWFSHPPDDETMLVSQERTAGRSRGHVRTMLILAVLGLILLAVGLMAAPF